MAAAAGLFPSLAKEGCPVRGGVVRPPQGPGRHRRFSAMAGYGLRLTRPTVLVLRYFSPYPARSTPVRSLQSHRLFRLRSPKRLR